MGVPNVSYKVEIAWTSNWKTPIASRVWTDVSDFVELHEGITIEYGRSDEVSTSDANTLTLTLDNKDGRFTYGNAASPYYPNVKLGRPIRVTGTFEGNDSVRFVGFVNEWPVEWPGDSAGYATTAISASSRLAYIGTRSPLLATRTVVALRNMNAVALWPLTSQAEGSNAAASSPFGAMAASSAAGVEFGSGAGPIGDDDSVVKVTPGGSLTAPGGMPAVDADDGFAVSFWIRPTAVPSGTARVLSLSGGAIGLTFDLSTSLTPQVQFTLPNGNVVNAPATPVLNLGEGRAYIVGARRVSATGWHWFVTVQGDFTYLGTNTGTTGTVARELDIRLGGGGDLALFEGALSDVGIYSGAGVAYAPSWSTDLFDGIAGWPGDTPTQRLQRIAGWAGLVDSPSVVGATPTTMDALNAEATSAETLMRQVESSEFGVLFDNREGFQTLLARTLRYFPRSASTLDVSTDRLAGYAPKVDRQGLVNLATVTGPSGDATIEDAASRDEYGDASYTAETFSQNPDDPHHIASWVVNTRSEPRARVSAPTLNVLDWLGTGISMPLSLGIWSRLKLTNAPTQAPDAAAVTYVIEGYTENIGVGSWTIAPNLSPLTLEFLVLELDSATYGVLDTNVIAL